MGVVLMVKLSQIIACVLIWSKLLGLHLNLVIMKINLRQVLIVLIYLMLPLIVRPSLIINLILVLLKWILVNVKLVLVLILVKLVLLVMIRLLLNNIISKFNWKISSFALDYGVIYKFILKMDFIDGRVLISLDLKHFMGICLALVYLHLHLI